MDPKIIIIIVAAVVLINLIFIFIFKTISNKRKGQIGEKKVRNVLIKYAVKDNYLVDNLILNTKGNHRSTQIDHVLLTKKGIFVVETKNFGGKVYGSINNKEWTQVLAYGKIKNTFLNPIFQNKTHLLALRKVLGSDVNYINLVVFVQNNAPLMNTVEVINFDILSKYIEYYTSDTEIDEARLDELATKLNNLKKYQISTKQHIKNLSKESKDTTKKIG